MAGATSPTAGTSGPLRVGHSVVAPGAPLTELPARLDGAGWDMVELDVLALGDRLVVAHDPSDLTRPDPVDFAAALQALAALVEPEVRFDVDIKTTGYEPAVAEAIEAAGLTARTLVSTMEVSSLAALRRVAPALTLGLSVPLARRDYLANPFIRPAAYAMLAYLRATLPAQVGRALDEGVTDAIMAHWGVVSPRLVRSVHTRGAELFVWTVDDPGRVAGLVALGVDGIITNERELFARAGL